MGKKPGHRMDYMDGMDYMDDMDGMGRGPEMRMWQAKIDLMFFGKWGEGPFRRAVTGWLCLNGLFLHRLDRGSRCWCASHALSGMGIPAFFRTRRELVAALCRHGLDGVDFRRHWPVLRTDDDARKRMRALCREQGR